MQTEREMYGQKNGQQIDQRRDEEMDRQNRRRANKGWDGQKSAETTEDSDTHSQTYL